ncbi:hypothetical protein HXX76_005321 [Chlamydomonas incerta]|uniref:Guanylate cyclase domain-containing protein n=1 Tax=Chlamydomonas incerta TaxID=51695 RepID=A0A835W6B6_CHLIN|nr:hypothetical protein HXX76_005321 [Chlamydomonas incerta]|eukprot:KAG2438779.1 hypothetical protein HXX76_005321 [Chlamydomonas incerta]
MTGGILLWLLLALLGHCVCSLHEDDWLTQEAYGDYGRYCLLSAAKELQQSCTNRTLLAVLNECGNATRDEPVHVLLGPLPRVAELLEQLLPLPGPGQPEAEWFSMERNQWDAHQTQLARGRNATFDLLALDPALLPDMVASGALLDLGPFIATDTWGNKWPRLMAAVRWSLSRNTISTTSAAAVLAAAAGGGGGGGSNGGGDSVYGMPLGTSVIALHYRRDVLAAHGLGVPVTWEQLAGAAGAAHGRPGGPGGVPDADFYGLCTLPFATCHADAFELLAVYASLAQTRGLAQGAFFDPASFQPLVQSPAMAAALRLLRRLYAFGPPRGLANTTEYAGSCGSLKGTAERLYAAGRCAFFIGPHPVHKDHLLHAPSDAVRAFGRLAHLPGSTQVWDRDSGSLQPCTPALCPYAVATPAQPADVAAAAAAAAVAQRRQRRRALLAAGTAAAAPANASSRLVPAAAASAPAPASGSAASASAAAAQPALAVGDVLFANVAPLMGLSPLSVGADALTTHNMQAHSLGWLARLTDPEVLWAFMLDPDVPLGPVAYEHVDPANVRRWAAAGYPAAAITDYLALTSQALAHPNQLGFPGALQRFSSYRATLHAAAYNMSMYGGGAAAAYGNGSASGAGAPAGAAGRSEADIMAAMAATLAAQFGPGVPGYGTLRLQYLVSIGRWDLLNAPAPAAPPPPEDERFRVGRITVPSSVKYKPAGPAVAAAVTCVGVAALAALAALGYRQLLVKRGWGRRADPGLGPATSLVVTDIEASTVLWEELDALVMDMALNLHHDTLRQAIAQHGGYESVTEGDSFTVAFHDPDSAVRFCLQIQADLMAQPWPAEVLQHDACRAVHVITAKQLRHVMAKATAKAEAAAAQAQEAATAKADAAAAASQSGGSAFSLAPHGGGVGSGAISGVLRTFSRTARRLEMLSGLSANMRRPLSFIMRSGSHQHPHVGGALPAAALSPAPSQSGLLTSASLSLRGGSPMAAVLAGAVSPAPSSAGGARLLAATNYPGGGAGSDHLLGGGVGAAPAGAHLNALASSSVRGLARVGSGAEYELPEGPAARQPWLPLYRAGGPLGTTPSGRMLLGSSPASASAGAPAGARPDSSGSAASGVMGGGHLGLAGWGPGAVIVSEFGVACVDDAESARVTPMGTALHGTTLDGAVGSAGGGGGGGGPGGGAMPHRAQSLTQALARSPGGGFAAVLGQMPQPSAAAVGPPAHASHGHPNAHATAAPNALRASSKAIMTSVLPEESPPQSATLVLMRRTRSSTAVAAMGAAGAGALAAASASHHSDGGGGTGAGTTSAGSYARPSGVGAGTGSAAGDLLLAQLTAVAQQQQQQQQPQGGAGRRPASAALGAPGPHRRLLDSMAPLAGPAAAAAGAPPSRLQQARSFHFGALRLDSPAQAQAQAPAQAQPQPQRPASDRHCDRPDAAYAGGALAAAPGADGADAPTSGGRITAAVPLSPGAAAAALDTTSLTAAAGPAGDSPTASTGGGGGRPATWAERLLSGGFMRRLHRSFHKTASGGRTLPVTASAAAAAAVGTAGVLALSTGGGLAEGGGIVEGGGGGGGAVQSPTASPWDGDALGLAGGVDHLGGGGGGGDDNSSDSRSQSSTTGTSTLSYGTSLQSALMLAHSRRGAAGGGGGGRKRRGSAALGGPGAAKKLFASPTTYGAELKAKWVELPPGLGGENSRGAVLVYRGFRVRCGIHSGVEEEAELNRAHPSGRTRYSGPILLYAKAVSDAAHGGMVFASRHAVRLCDKNLLAGGDVVLWRLGDYILGAPKLPATLYQLHSTALVLRAALQRPLTRTFMPLGMGLLDAPLVMVGVGLVRISSLWLLQGADPRVSLEAACVFQALCYQYARHHRGYLAQLGGGRALAVFPNAYLAALWAAAVHTRMLRHAWSRRLLATPTCEPLWLPPAAAATGMGGAAGAAGAGGGAGGGGSGGGSISGGGGAEAAVLVERGPRVKGVVHWGSAAAILNSLTGVLAYEGPVVDQLMRLLTALRPNAVVATQEAAASLRRYLPPGYAGPGGSGGSNNAPGGGSGAAGGGGSGAAGGGGSGTTGGGSAGITPPGTAGQHQWPGGGGGGGGGRRTTGTSGGMGEVLGDGVAGGGSGWPPYGERGSGTGLEGGGHGSGGAVRDSVASLRAHLQAGSALPYLHHHPAPALTPSGRFLPAPQHAAPAHGPPSQSQPLGPAMQGGLAAAAAAAAVAAAGRARQLRARSSVDLLPGPGHEPMANQQQRQQAQAQAQLRSQPHAALRPASATAPSMRAPALLTPASGPVGGGAAAAAGLAAGPQGQRLAAGQSPSAASPAARTLRMTSAAGPTPALYPLPDNDDGNGNGDGGGDGDGSGEYAVVNASQNLSSPFTQAAAMARQPYSSSSSSTHRRTEAAMVPTGTVPRARRSANAAAGGGGEAAGSGAAAAAGDSQGGAGGGAAARATRPPSDRTSLLLLLGNDDDQRGSAGGGAGAGAAISPALAGPSGASDPAGAAPGLLSSVLGAEFPFNMSSAAGAHAAGADALRPSYAAAANGGSALFATPLLSQTSAGAAGGGVGGCGGGAIRLLGWMDSTAPPSKAAGQEHVQQEQLQEQDRGDAGLLQAGGGAGGGSRNAGEPGAGASGVQAVAVDVDTVAAVEAAQTRGPQDGSGSSQYDAVRPDGGPSEQATATEAAAAAAAREASAELGSWQQQLARLQQQQQRQHAQAHMAAQQHHHHQQQQQQGGAARHTRGDGVSRSAASFTYGQRYGSGAGRPRLQDLLAVSVAAGAGAGAAAGGADGAAGAACPTMAEGATAAAAGSNHAPIAAVAAAAVMQQQLQQSAQSAAGRQESPAVAEARAAGYTVTDGGSSDDDDSPAATNTTAAAAAAAVAEAPRQTSTPRSAAVSPGSGAARPPRTPQSRPSAQTQPPQYQLPPASSPGRAAAGAAAGGAGATDQVSGLVRGPSRLTRSFTCTTYRRSPLAVASGAADQQQQQQPLEPEISSGAGGGGSSASSRPSSDKGQHHLQLSASSRRGSGLWQVSYAAAAAADSAAGSAAAAVADAEDAAGPLPPGRQPGAPAQPHWAARLGLPSGLSSGAVSGGNSTGGAAVGTGNSTGGHDSRELLRGSTVMSLATSISFTSGAQRRGSGGAAGLLAADASGLPSPLSPRGPPRDSGAAPGGGITGSGEDASGAEAAGRLHSGGGGGGVASLGVVLGGGGGRTSAAVAATASPPIPVPRRHGPVTLQPHGLAAPVAAAAPVPWQSASSSSPLGIESLAASTAGGGVSGGGGGKGGGITVPSAGASAQLQLPGPFPSEHSGGGAGALTAAAAAHAIGASSYTSGSLPVSRLLLEEPQQQSPNSALGLGDSRAGGGGGTPAAPSHTGSLLTRLRLGLGLGGALSRPRSRGLDAQAAAAALAAGSDAASSGGAGGAAEQQLSSMDLRASAIGSGSAAAVAAAAAAALGHGLGSMQSPPPPPLSTASASSACTAPSLRGGRGGGLMPGTGEKLPTLPEAGGPSQPHMLQEFVHLQLRLVPMHLNGGGTGGPAGSGLGGGGGGGTGTGSNKSSRKAAGSGTGSVASSTALTAKGMTDSVSAQPEPLAAASAPTTAEQVPVAPLSQSGLVERAPSSLARRPSMRQLMQSQQLQVLHQQLQQQQQQQQGSAAAAALAAAAHARSRQGVPQHGSGRSSQCSAVYRVELVGAAQPHQPRPQTPGRRYSTQRGLSAGRFTPAGLTSPQAQSLYGSQAQPPPPPPPPPPPAAATHSADIPGAAGISGTPFAAGGPAAAAAAFGSTPPQQPPQQPQLQQQPGSSMLLPLPSTAGNTAGAAVSSTLVGQSSGIDLGVGGDLSTTNTLTSGPGGGATGASSLRVIASPLPPPSPRAPALPDPVAAALGPIANAHPDIGPPAGAPPPPGAPPPGALPAAPTTAEYLAATVTPTMTLTSPLPQPASLRIAQLPPPQPAALSPMPPGAAGVDEDDGMVFEYLSGFAELSDPDLAALWMTRVDRCLLQDRRPAHILELRAKLETLEAHAQVFDRDAFLF